jgi:hypothetical protein
LLPKHSPEKNAYQKVQIKSTSLLERTLRPNTSATAL